MKQNTIDLFKDIQTRRPYSKVYIKNRLPPNFNYEVYNAYSPQDRLFLFKKYLNKKSNPTKYYVYSKLLNKVVELAPLTKPQNLHIPFNIINPNKRSQLFKLIRGERHTNVQKYIINQPKSPVELLLLEEYYEANPNKILTPSN